MGPANKTRNYNARFAPLYMATAGLTSPYLIRLLLEQLHIEPRFRYTENQSLVAQALLDRYASGQPVVLVIDEAHDLPSGLLEELRFLLNFHADSFSPLSLWLVGQSKLRETL